jgi:hypothetical protein
MAADPTLGFNPDLLEWHRDFGCFPVSLDEGITGELFRIEGRTAPVGVIEMTHFRGLGWQLSSEHKCEEPLPGIDGTTDLTTSFFRGTAAATTPDDAKAWAAKILSIELGQDVTPDWSRGLRPKRFTWQDQGSRVYVLENKPKKALQVGRRTTGTVCKAQWWFHYRGWRRADRRETAQGCGLHAVDRYYATVEELSYAAAESWVRSAFTSEQIEITGKPDSLLKARLSSPMTVGSFAADTQTAPRTQAA